MTAKHRAMLKTLAKTFLTAALGQYLLMGLDVFSASASDWQVVAASGITAVAMLAYNWLDPTDTRYGRGSE